jgi:sugar phosphate isomerase/epimerase
MYRLGYNTNGFKGHPLPIAIEILADLGYRSVAITIDHHAINPWAADIDLQLNAVKRLLHRKQIGCVIETGAGFLLDPWRKHQPSLISANRKGRAQRMDFLKKAINLAAQLDADAVSFWAGQPVQGVACDQAWAWLVHGCGELCDHAATQDVALALEPEPGMLVETLADYDRLKSDVNNTRLGLALDLGHAHLTEACSLAATIQTYSADIRTIHIEDMRRPVHEHLMFGEGEIDFIPIFKALEVSGYTGSACVELSRHSHDAINAAQKAISFLNDCRLAAMSGDTSAEPTPPWKIGLGKGDPATRNV